MTAHTKKRRYFSLILFLLLSLGVGLTGKFWTEASVNTWYPTLIKPGWNPPAWVFGPVWTILYIMMAIAAWLIFIAEPSAQRTKALVLYVVQLFCNLIWSYLFFYLRNPLYGLLDIVVLVVLVGWLIVTSCKVSKKAAFLLVPYLLWLLYALTLNAAIWLWNPTG